MRRPTGLVAVAGVVAAWVLGVALPAAAACHVAGFVQTQVDGSPAGVVSLVVELQGRQPSCAGTVDVATVDGTATAGEDYEPVERTLTFEEGDDRVETVDIPVLDGADDGETFTVELSDPTGGISGTGDPATVTIAAAGGGAGSETAEPTAEESAPAAEESTPPAAEESPPAAQETAAPGQEATTDEADGTMTAVEEQSSLPIVLAVIGAVVIGGTAFVLLRGRGA